MLKSLLYKKCEKTKAKFIPKLYALIIKFLLSLHIKHKTYLPMV